MQYVAIGLLVLVGCFGALVAYFRISQARAKTRMREDILKYVTSRGGTVTFDDANGMNVSGSRGSGYVKLTALAIMLSSGSGDRALTIGFALRKYLPDQFDDKFEQLAADRLAGSRDAIAALSPEELRARLRVRIVSARSSSTGLAPCARSMFDGFEGRVVLDGFDLDGIPATARARFTEDDSTLFDVALAQTNGAVPDFDQGEAEGHAWLAAPERIFGTRAVVVGACGTKLVWLLARPDGAARALASLASRSGADGPMKNVLASWDGSALERIPVRVHTIMGPTTPDFTLQMSPALSTAFGLQVDAEGGIGVSRASLVK